MRNCSRRLRCPCARRASPAAPRRRRKPNTSTGPSRSRRAARCGSRTSRDASPSPASTGRTSSIDAVRRATRDRLDHIKLDIHTEGSTLVVDANQRDRSWFGLDAQQQRRRNRLRHQGAAPHQPRRRRLQLAGDRRAASRDRTRCTAFRRACSLEDVTGPIRAHTFSGSVEIAPKSWEPDQSIDVDTFSGNVELHLPRPPAGRSPSTRSAAT